MPIHVANAYGLEHAQNGGLSSMLSGVTPYDPLYFYPRGCLLPNGNHDCHAACRNITQVMGNAETFVNCLSYPIISQAMSIDNLTYDEDAPRAANYGIIANDTARDVISSIQGCLSDYCVGMDCGRSSNDTIHYCYKDNDIYHPPGKSTDNCFIDICGPSSISLNADIGGIGVYVSYWMQFLLALLAFILLELYTSWTYYICITIFWCSHGRVKARSKAKGIQDSVTHHAVPLLSALVEFQKAQCFFAIAVEVAAQILAPAGSLGVNNQGQLFTNYEFIRMTSIHGSLPITFTLLCLRRAGIKSWYLFTLSACAVLLSVATYVSVDKVEKKLYEDPNGFNLPFTTNLRIDSCGGVNPSTWCDNSQYDGLADISTTGLGSLVSSAFVLGLMLFDQCGFADLPIIQNFLDRFAGLRNWRRSRIFAKVMFILMWCNYLVWFALGCTNLSSFMEVGAIDTSTWGFGQIVAVTIWIPSLFEYFYLEIKGMEHVFQLRLGQYYKVVKVAPGDFNPHNTFVTVRSALQNIRKFKFKTSHPSGYSSVESPVEHPLVDLAQQHPRALGVIGHGTKG